MKQTTIDNSNCLMSLTINEEKVWESNNRCVTPMTDMKVFVAGSWTSQFGTEDGSVRNLRFLNL